MRQSESCGDKSDDEQHDHECENGDARDAEAFDADLGDGSTHEERHAHEVCPHGEAGEHDDAEVYRDPRQWH